MDVGLYINGKVISPVSYRERQTKLETPTEEIYLVDGAPIENHANFKIEIEGRTTVHSIRQTW